MRTDKDIDLVLNSLGPVGINFLGFADINFLGPVIKSRDDVWDDGVISRWLGDGVISKSLNDVRRGE